MEGRKREEKREGGQRGTEEGETPDLTRLAGYHHHSIQQARLCPGSRLQPLHGPFLHDGRDVRVVHVEDPEPGQVHPRVAVGLQV